MRRKLYLGHYLLLLSVLVNFVLVWRLASSTNPTPLRFTAAVWALANCEGKLKRYAEIDVLATQMEKMIKERE